MGSENQVSVVLNLLTKNVEVRAIYTFKLMDPVVGRPGVVQSWRAPQLFGGSVSWGSLNFMKMTAQKDPVYLRDDRLVIECDIDVIKGETPAVQLPPSNLSDDLGKLLAEKEGADVTFSV